MYRTLTPLPVEAMARALGRYFKKAEDSKLLLDGIAMAEGKKPADSSAGS